MPAVAPTLPFIVAQTLPSLVMAGRVPATHARTAATRMPAPHTHQTHP
jgi:hypothetical protein